VGLDEDDALALRRLVEHPEDEVRVETTLFKKADALAAAQVAQQEYFFSGQGTSKSRKIPEVRVRKIP